jgi:hypothetical protein
MADNNRRDFTQIALDVVKQATGETNTPKPSKKQESGRKGGLAGGTARATALTPEQRSDISRRAAEARWKKP